MRLPFRDIPASGGQSTEASLSASKQLSGCAQIIVIEVRPHPVGENELSVSALPQQKIAQALLSRSPYQQIDVGSGELGSERLSRQRVSRAGLRRSQETVPG